MDTHTYGDYGTGAVALPQDWRDHQMHRVPGVEAQIDAGIPEEASLEVLITTVYDQGKVPACTAYSLAALKSIQEAQEQGRWRIFDALRCYHDCGGDDRHGIDTRKALKLAQDVGMVAADGGDRYRIDTYAFAPQVDPLWQDSIKGAIAAGHPVVVAMLLPSAFGWDSMGSPTNSYHQMCAVGYTRDHLVCLNSWGAGWGKHGLCRVPWAYMVANRFQRGLCYAYLVTDARNPRPEPSPSPLPEPAPTFKVNGFIGLTRRVEAVSAGGLVQIVGDGLDAPGINATYAGQPVEIVERQPRLLTIKMPKSIRGPAMSWVQVRQRAGGPSAFTPMLVVNPEE